jgi:hypothetical protein
MPPVKTTSTVFIAISIASMEIKDIPIAVLKASDRIICLESIKVSRRIDVINPLIMAKTIIPIKGKSISMIWK